VFVCFSKQDSNQFHSVCLDTYPPILYLNDVSKKVIRLVTRYNELRGEIKVSGERGTVVLVCGFTPFSITVDSFISEHHGTRGCSDMQNTTFSIETVHDSI